MLTESAFVVLLVVTVLHDASSIKDDGTWSWDGGNNGVTSNTLPEVCVVPPLTGIRWVLYKRLPDYGWGEDTHRAIVVLELNDYGNLRDNVAEIELMRHQLEIQLSKALLRNGQLPIADLALYIQALLAIKHDPRDFYGVNLVEKLLDQVESQAHPHPFVIQILCSARALEMEHLQKIRDRLRDIGAKSVYEKELSAIALKAFVCASWDKDIRQYDNEMSVAAQYLADLQKNDGSFGNLYTTALISQALKVYEKVSWNEHSAINFLKAHESKNVNMLSVYYLQMVYHAVKGLFRTKKLVSPLTAEGFPTLEALKSLPLAYYVQYTLKVGDMPEVYHTITIKIPANATFFDVMRLAEDEDPKFRFSYHLNGRNEPRVYQIAGIPNDAEHGIYWRLVHETAVDHVRHTSRLEETKRSPLLVEPTKDTHFIYHYCNAFKNLDGINSGDVNTVAPR